MSHLAIIVLVALITFLSRASFMLWRPSSRSMKENRFLEVFPVALFVAFAVTGFVAPRGELDFTPTLAAAAGGLAGAVIFRRSIAGIMACGLVIYWLARNYL
jgi:branched-subunit amino acid transport protein